MGEEDPCRTPFLYFTDHHGELGKAVREGRRREFAAFTGFQEGETAQAIPDPNVLQTFDSSRPVAGARRGAERRALYKKLLGLRMAVLVPHLAGARALAARSVGPAAVVARWRLEDGAVFSLVSNLGGDLCPIEQPVGDLLFESRTGAGEEMRRGRLQGPAAAAFLEPPG